jgi:hypothetical protein
MNKIGILGCGYACDEGLNERLETWFEYVNSAFGFVLGGKPKEEFVFSFVSAKFKEYDDLDIKQDNTKTIQKLSQYIQEKKIQYLEVPDKSLLEHQARNLALNHLLEEGCDWVFLLDLSDEFYTQENISKILSYINREDNKFYYWFSIPMKNYIFSGKEWIAGFCPPRVFRTKLQNTIIDKCFWDNDIQYKNEKNIIDYRVLPSRSIPLNQINGGIRHMTWLHTNGEFKEKYQRKHFNGICSYKFNKEKGLLEFDSDYYKDKPLPIIYKDE